MANRIYPGIVPNPSAALGYDGTDFRVLLVDTAGSPLVVASCLGSEGVPLKTDAAGRLEVKAGQLGGNYLGLLTDLSGQLRVLPGNDGSAPSYLLVDSAGYLTPKLIYDGSVWRSWQGDSSGVPNARVGYDGAAWRALKTTTGSYLYAQPRPHKITSVLVALAAVAAGATRTEVNINGSGFFMGFSHYMDGAAIGCSNTYCDVYIDGEASPSLHLRCNSYTHDLINTTYAAAPAAGAFLSCPVGWGGHYDAANFIYSGGFVLESHFTTSLRVNVVNGDAANATSIRSMTWYALWV